MARFYQCFPIAQNTKCENPDKHRAFANFSYNPKRITKRNSLILAKMRGFCVYRGPPGVFSIKDKK